MNPLSRPPRNPLLERPRELPNELPKKPGVRSALKMVRQRAGLLLFGLMPLVACDSPISEPPIEPPDPPAEAAAHTVVVAWNELARNLVAVHGTSPPAAARAYALLSVAQFDALTRLRGGTLDLHALASRHAGVAPAAWASRSSNDARLDAVAVTTASAALLAYLYPVEKNALASRAAINQTQLAASAGRARDDLASAIAAGEAAAEAAIARARTDGSDAVWDGVIPTGPDKWFSSAEPAQPPLLPAWGEVRPWLMESGSQFRSPPPPAMDSPDFISALAEVRAYSDNRTPEQQRIAEYWADGPGTFAPPGHWNEIAADLIVEYDLDALDAARVFAYTNMAMMDAGIACWDAKFTYWLLRPTQVDPEIELAVGLPNFPAYTSGHSSFSGAAAAVLGHFFPAESGNLEAFADEAAMSRVYGGIHFRFDSDRGLEQGRAIAQLAIAEAIASQE